MEESLIIFCPRVSLEDRVEQETHISCVWVVLPSKIRDRDVHVVWLSAHGHDGEPPPDEQ